MEESDIVGKNKAPDPETRGLDFKPQPLTEAMVQNQKPTSKLNSSPDLPESYKPPEASNLRQ